jgi:hypothetical protein
MKPAARTPSSRSRNRKARTAAASPTARSQKSVKGGASRPLSLSPPSPPSGPVPIPYPNIPGPVKRGSS